MAISKRVTCRAEIDALVAVVVMRPVLYVAINSPTSSDGTVVHLPDGRHTSPHQHCWKALLYFSVRWSSRTTSSSDGVLDKHHHSVAAGTRILAGLEYTVILPKRGLNLLVTDKATSSRDARMPSSVAC